MNAYLAPTLAYKDLGLILSEDFSWDRHYKTISCCPCLRSVGAITQNNIQIDTNKP